MTSLNPSPQPVRGERLPGRLVSRAARSIAAMLAVLLPASILPLPARAIPVFAHRYGLSCQACHSTVPQLNEFGERFKAAGFRLPDRQRYRPLPVALKVNLRYSSEPDPSGLPKAVVDEVELLSGGDVGRDISYFVESYLVDGGRPGSVRDAWLRYDARQEDSKRQENGGSLFALRAGQFTLPLPVDPESFRPTLNHYAVFDQTIGANRFNLFDPRIGVEAILGAEEATQLHLLALRGHDPQSGIPAHGTDLGAYADTKLGRLRLSTYRYQGTRPVGPAHDRFWRQAYGATAEKGRLWVAAIAQTGVDSNADGVGTSVLSSGGFLEARWAFSPVLLGVACYNGTNDPSGLQRSTTLSLVRRITKNSKVTVEGVFSHGRQTLNTGLLFAL